MDDTWKFLQEYCNQKDDDEAKCNDHDNSVECGTPEPQPRNRPLPISMDPEFRVSIRDKSIVYEKPILKINKFHRPRPLIVKEEDPCDEIEVPFPIYEYEFLCNEIPDPVWNSTFLAQRMFLLLHITPEITDIETRICDLWKFFERKSPNGVFIKDIRLLLGLVFCLTSKRNEGELSDFGKCFLSKIVAQLKRGIRIQRLGDKEDLSGLSFAFNDFAEMIRRNYRDLIQVAFEILEMWLKIHVQEDYTLVRKSTKATRVPCTEFQHRLLDHNTFVKALEQSRLGKRLVQRICEEDPMDEFSYARLTSLVAELIDLSPIIKLLALKRPVIEALLLKLKCQDSGNQLLISTIHVIYGLLASPLEDESIDSLPALKPEAFRVLLFRFLQRIKDIRSKAEMSLRNDVGFAVFLLAKYFPNLRENFGPHSFVLAGIVANNVLQQKDLPFILDSTPADLELLKFLIWILQLVLEQEATTDEIVTKYQLVMVMTRILIGPCHLTEYQSDGDPCLEPLNKVVSLTLITIAKRFPLLFQHRDGIDAMLGVLDIFGRFGNLDLTVVSSLLDTLRILLVQDLEGMVEYFTRRNAMQILTDVLKELGKREWTISDEPLMCNVLMCCSVLGAYDERQRAIFVECQGVKILVRIINLVAYSFANQRHMNPTLHICIAEVVWHCLAESPSAMEAFLAYEGIFRLLDLLEIAAGPGAQLHLLSSLVELSEYPRCVDQLMYWRRRQNNFTKRFAQGDDFYLSESRGGENSLIVGDGVGDVVLDRDGSLSALLCELWRNEEKRFKVLRETNGVIASLDNPLKSEFSRNFTMPKSSVCNGPSYLDLITSIRPKIYLLMKKIIDASNTEAIVFGGLSLPNQLTMQIIINFLDLKRGEIWVEKVEELKAEGMKLVESDEIALTRFLKISKNKVSAVIDTQRYLINRVQEQNEMNERNLYNTIQMCYLQDHLEALKEAEFFARTSNYFLLIDKRLWQKAQLQQVVQPALNANTRIHRTTDNSLNITNWPGRTKIVESEPNLEFEGDDDMAARLSANRKNIADYSEGQFDGDEMEDERSSDECKTTPHVVSSFEPNTAFGSVEEGMTQVSPKALYKALVLLLAEEKKWKWREAVGENAWRMRSKWRRNWYSSPPVSMHLMKTDD